MYTHIKPDRAKYSIWEESIWEKHQAKVKIWCFGEINIQKEKYVSNDTVL